MMMVMLLLVVIAAIDSTTAVIGVRIIIKVNTITTNMITTTASTIIMIAPVSENDSRNDRRGLVPSSCGRLELLELLLVGRLWPPCGELQGEGESLQRRSIV